MNTVIRSSSSIITSRNGRHKFEISRGSGLFFSWFVQQFVFVCNVLHMIHDSFVCVCPRKRHSGELYEVCLVLLSTIVSQRLENVIDHRFRAPSSLPWNPSSSSPSIERYKVSHLWSTLCYQVFANVSLNRRIRNLLSINAIAITGTFLITL